MQYIFMLLTILFNSLAHIALKYNALNVSNYVKWNVPVVKRFNITPLFFLAIMCFASSVVFYNRVLEKMQLNIAFPVMNSVVYVIIAFASWYIFKESLSFRNIAGLLLILIGLYMVYIK